MNGFVDKWFDEVRISRRAESLAIVSAAPTRELIYAACTTSSMRLPFIQRG
jgi:hypothetical protein